MLAVTQSANGQPTMSAGNFTARGYGSSDLIRATAFQLSGRTNVVADPNGGPPELQPGASIATIGSSIGTAYDFRFVFWSSMLQLFINKALEWASTGCSTYGVFQLRAVTRLQSRGGLF